MKYNRLLGTGVYLLPAFAWAVYAPIPGQEQGKPFTVTIETSVYHDSNIFGSATNATASMVYALAPRLSFNASVAPRTFASTSYQATFDYFDNRPGDRLLVSHDGSLRLAHEFTPVSHLDLNEEFQVEKNPQSLLAGVPLNSDQSFQRNQFDGRWTTALDQRTGVVLKYRDIIFDYRDAGLGQSLDRGEHLAGLELNNKFLPEITVSGEYRYQAIDYDHGGALKDKQSNFLLAGADYSMGKQLSLVGRAGWEHRRRAGDRDTTAPDVELTAKYQYAEKSFVAGGYTHSLEETDDPAHFTDTRMNRFFVNVQHALTAMLVTSGSITVESATLLGRLGVPSIDESGTRLGLALSYVQRKNLTLSATYDYDRVNSDAPNRRQNRTRVGITGRLYF